MLNAVVDYTREHVDIRSHTIKRKSYNECFTGADVADVVFHCLRTDRVICPNSVSREQAVKVSFKMKIDTDQHLDCCLAT